MFVRTRKRFVSIGIAIAVAFSGGIALGLVVRSWRAHERLGDQPPSAPTSSSTVPRSIPDVLVVTCTVDRVLLASRSVRPRSDGIHLQVAKDGAQSTGMLVDYLQDGSWIHGRYTGQGSNVIGPSGSQMVWVIPPGKARAVCLFPDSINPEAVFDVVDPANLYVSPILTCERGTSYDVFLPLDLLLPSERIDAARRVLHGLRVADLLQTAGYPNQHPPIVRVVRDGRVVARVDFGPLRTSSVTACAGSSITAA